MASSFLLSVAWLATGTAALIAEMRPESLACCPLAGASIVELCASRPLSDSCGHNLIAGAALSAVAGLKSIASHLPGRVVFLGTPGEEGGGGKIILINNGALRRVDAAMMAHPTDAEFCTMPALATQHLKLTFHGHGAHAAMAPWDGSSALAAVIQTFQSVDAMRLHLRDGSRIHGIITDGGRAVNIIPERTECLFLARARTSRYANEIGARVIRCAEGAAMATG